MRVLDIVGPSLEEDISAAFKKASTKTAAYAGLALAGASAIGHMVPPSLPHSVSGDADTQIIYEPDDHSEDDIERPLLHGEYAEKMEAERAIAAGRARAAKLGHANNGHAKPTKARVEMVTKAEHVLALTMWGEARNQGPAGMAAVGHVIVNRANANHPSMFGSGIVGVAWKHKQFSCWNKGDPNREAMRGIASLPHDSLDWARWVQAKKLAHAIMTGHSKDPTRGATYYHTKSIDPFWKDSVDKVAQLGQHVFYALKDKLG